MAFKERSERMGMYLFIYLFIYFRNKEFDIS